MINNKFYFTIKLFYLFIFLGSFIVAKASSESGFTPIGFEKNIGQVFDDKGQFRKDVFFTANMPGANVFFTQQGLVYDFYKSAFSTYDSIRAGYIPNPYTNEAWDKLEEQLATGTYEGNIHQSNHQHYRVDITFPGADLSRAVGESERFEKRNYFNPQHPDGLNNVPLFNKVIYKEAYRNIDLIFYLAQGKLKYDFIVKPNANPEDIKIVYQGHENIYIDEIGNARIKILPGEIVELKPISYQNNKEVVSRFALKNDTLQFAINQYDARQTLTIDPAIEWSTFFYDNTSNSMFYTTNPVYDSNDNLYIVMNTNNRTVFPTIDPGGGAWIQSVGGSFGLQLVILKFNAARQLLWSTYYAGSQTARTAFTNQAIAIDLNDNLFVTGEIQFTISNPPNTFPLFNPGGGAYFETTLGNGRSFILKFSPQGQRLWATMFSTSVVNGSSSNLELLGITIDNNNKLVMTGSASLPGQSSSWTPIPLVNPGGGAYFRNPSNESSTPTLHRFNTTTGALEWSTYITQGVAGAFNGNFVGSIDVDNNGNIFVGSSASQLFNGGGPTPYTTVNPGGGAYIDGFNTGTNNGRKLSLFKFNASGALVWCTLYGGNISANSVIWQDVRQLKVAPSGDLFVVGRTNTTNFPTLNPGGGAFIKTTLSTGGQFVTDGYVLQFSNNGVRKWATYYGGNGTSDGSEFFGIGIDANNNITIAGITWSSAFPTQFKTGSYNQSTSSGVPTRVLLQFNGSGVRQWASYFGDLTNSFDGGFGFKRAACGGSKFILVSNVDNASGSIPTLNPGGGAYFFGTKEGATGRSDFIAEFSESGSSGSGSGTPGIWGWTGAVSKDWFDPCNWDKLSVPTSSSPVLIPGSPANQPEIANGNAHCFNIEIQSDLGAELTINSSLSGSLEVHQP